MLILEWIAGVVVALLALLGALHALLTKRDPGPALMWVLLCLSIPVGGPLLYYMFGFNRLQRKAANLMRRRAGLRYSVNKKYRTALWRGEYSYEKTPQLTPPDNAQVQFAQVLSDIHSGYRPQMTPPVLPDDVPGDTPDDIQDDSIDDSAGKASREDAPNANPLSDGAPFYISGAIDKTQYPPMFAQLAGVGDAVNAFPLTRDNSVEPLRDGDAAYPEMLKAIHRAKKTIWLSSYIFSNDVIGRHFVDALEQAAQRSVQVRVLLDGLGTFSFLHPTYKMLRKRGLAVALFMPPRLFPPQLLINLRNHRKLLVVDGHTAFTGGINISLSHVRAAYTAAASGQDSFNLGGQTLPLPAKLKRQRLKFMRPLEVQDLHFKIQGPVVYDLQVVFAADWLFCTDESLPLLPFQPPRAVKKIPGTTLCRTVLDGPDNNFERFYSTILGAISCARHSVHIITPYFLPPRELSSSLQCAALRGVDVCVVLPQKNDQLAVHWATFNLLRELLARNVGIYYQPAPFAHAKLLLIDGYYTHFGSANLDPRSLRLNFELTVESFDAELASKLEEYFQNTVKTSRRYSLEDFEARSLPLRLRDALFYLASPYL